MCLTFLGYMTAFENATVVKIWQYLHSEIIVDNGYCRSLCLHWMHTDMNNAYYSEPSMWNLSGEHQLWTLNEENFKMMKLNTEAVNSRLLQ